MRLLTVANLLHIGSGGTKEVQRLLLYYQAQRKGIITVAVTITTTVSHPDVLRYLQLERYVDFAHLIL